ncbi:hypothetical protein EI005_25770 [Escherichia coli]|nr:hypothetical protein [Escherichia coli]
MPFGNQETTERRAIKSDRSCWVHTKREISHCLFTLNFLNEDKQGHVAAEQHVNADISPKGMVMWKDVLSGCWKGTDPVLVWARGSVCVFPQDRSPFQMHCKKN